MLTSILAVVIVLGGLIFFHELGHFVVARGMGMGVSVFSLGFGKRLFGITKGKTDYRVCAFPLGGYVQLVGESPDAELPEGFGAQESFSRRPPWQRMLVVLAGPVFNFILAWLIFWGLAFSQGVQELLPVIGQVTNSSAAEEAGIVPVWSQEELLEKRRQVNRVQADPDLIRYIVAIVKESREHPMIEIGASPRGSIALLQSAKACACYLGRDYIIPEDIKAMTMPVLRHRIVIRPELEIEGMKPDQVLADILAKVKVPR